jgi:hypothetical protein
MLLPIVSVTLGPIWASEVNAAFGVIDAHDHSSGKGTPVRTAGIYLDADLDFRGTNSKNARSARFALQTSLLGGISDVCCVYFSGADLYANDSAGNQIQLTSGGGVAGTSGSISGLASPASVVYTPATKLFKFYSGSNIWASMQTGPITISEAVLNGKGVTVSVPVGLATAYGLELPAALPASTKIVTLTSAGKVVADGVLPAPSAATDAMRYGDSFAAPTPVRPAIDANWTNGSGDSAIGYWKDRENVVHLIGNAQWHTGASTVIFTLPAGFRPLAQRWVPTVSASVPPKRCFIETNGNVTVAAGDLTNGYSYYLDSITFLAEQ